MCDKGQEDIRNALGFLLHLCLAEIMPNLSAVVSLAPLFPLEARRRALITPADTPGACRVSVISMAMNRVRG